jgi:hypothetical protein
MFEANRGRKSYRVVYDLLVYDDVNDRAIPVIIFDFAVDLCIKIDKD